MAECLRVGHCHPLMVARVALSIDKKSFVKLKHADSPSFQRTPVSTPATSIFAIISMTAGGPDMEVFRVSYSGENERAKEIPFLVVSYVIWLVFVVVMPIILINMLVSSVPAQSLSYVLPLLCFEALI